MSRPPYLDDPRDDEFPARPAGSGGGLLVGLLVGGGLLAALVVGGLAYVLMARGAARDRQAVGAARQVEATAVARPRTIVAPPKAMAGPIAGLPAEVAVVDGGDGHRILDHFAADPAGAEFKWVGKRVRIKQRVERIDGDKRGFYLVLACRAHVYAAGGEADRFGAIRPGEAIEVEATVTRFVGPGGADDQPPVVEAEAGRLIVNHGRAR